MATVPNPTRVRFEDVSPTLSVATAVVLAAGVTNVLGVTFLIIVTWPTIERGGFVTVVTYLSGVVYGIVGVVAAWVFLSSLFHVVSGLFDGEGSFRTTLVHTSLGFVPIACSGLLNAGAIYVSAHDATVPSAPERLGPFVSDLTSGLLFDAVTLLGVGFALWSGWIWIAGVQNAREISKRAAIKTVSVPLLVWIGWELSPFLAGAS